ncbi:MAG: nonstructural protein [Microvirus sp.]|nr:MAG: nonstructural protein [Microvirus sp.]
MDKYIFSVFDSKSRVFGTPFTSINKFTAIRDFNTAANDLDINIGKYPEDYTLYELASFDDESGMIAPHPQAVNLGSAIQFKQEA